MTSQRERNILTRVGPGTPMGEREEAPDLPQFEAVLSPEEELTITFIQRVCS